MLTVVTWLWSQPGFRTKYDSQVVITMRDMVAKYYRKPHRFVCVTDELIPGVETIPLGSAFSDLKNPTWENGPSCYRRLIAFRRDISKYFGDRFVSIDLDAIIMGDLSPLWDRQEDTVLLSGTSKNVPYCGAMWMMDSGSRPQVWNEFDQIDSPIITTNAGLKGSDQAWISYMLRDEASWKISDDIQDFAQYDKTHRSSRIKPDCRIMFFNGRRKPWDKDVRSIYPWIREVYPYEQEREPHMDKNTIDRKHFPRIKKRGIICR